jgi:2-succinyl-5-enolpyruvyl-6-hydroxy-3-cyclohexene-1-carboxylate synthase
MSLATTPEQPQDPSPQNTAATFCATLIDEWIEHGVRHAVISPGSRSTPMALALTARPELAVHVAHDERVASFIALGIGLQGTPAILLCTSGTAAAHFHAAVVEAHQSAVPMIICTADRPPELRDVGAAQTIDQTKLYGDAVRWFHDPGVADSVAAHTWRSLAAHSFSSSTGVWPGPVHLNLPFREPLVGVVAPLPARRAAPGRSVSLSSSPAASPDALVDLAALLNSGRGVIVAGHGCGDPAAVVLLAQALGWPVLADSRSGLRHFNEVAAAAADQLLRHAGFALQHIPHVVLRLGEPPASKVLNQWLTASNAVQIQISAVPTWADPDAAISHQLTADVAQVCRSLVALGLASAADARWLTDWTTAEAHAQQAITTALDNGPTAALTEPLVARSIGASLPAHAHLVVSSSMPIRDVEWFGEITEGVTVHCNRGANGIDGVVATAIGVAVATGAPTALLIGDVAFVHDSSALIALMSRRNADLRIVVVDNDGGGIFSFLPQASALASERFEQLFGTPHGTDLVALAAAHSIPAATVHTLAELRAALAVVGPQVIRVQSTRDANVAVHQLVNEAVSAAIDLMA